MASFIPKIEYTEINTGTPKSFTFDSPPEGDPFGERLRIVARSKRSSGGQQQTQWNYNLKEYRLRFIFQSQTLKDAFEDFIKNHAGRGGSFNYYPSEDEVDFETFEMSTTNFSFSRPIPTGVSGVFEYDLRFTIEKVE